MKRLFEALGLIAVFAVTAPALMAQWPDYPTPGVPKTATGEPNLTAPAPRTADGKVDLSGLWQRGGGGGGGGGGRGGANAAGGQRGAAAGGGGAAAAGQRGAAAGGGGAAAAGQRGAPAGNAAPAGAAPAGAAPAAGQRGAGGGQRGGGAAAAPGGIPVSSFGSAGAGMPDDLPFQPWAKELMDKRRADNSKDNPDAHCLPMGFLQFHNHPEPRKIIQTPGVILIIYEANSGLRQIFTDGRPLPPKDAQPWWYGYSVGKWEGDTLVVETTNFTDLQWLDVRGSPLTDQAKVTERFRRTNYGTLEIDITVDDPKAYTKPWTTRVNQRIMLNTELIEFICEDRDAIHYVGASAPK